MTPEGPTLGTLPSEEGTGPRGAAAIQFVVSPAPARARFAFSRKGVLSGPRYVDCANGLLPQTHDSNEMSRVNDGMPPLL
jgi:hypothetical protein